MKCVFAVRTSAVNVDLHRHSEVVGGAVESEGAGDLDGGVASGRDSAVVFLRDET